MTQRQLFACLLFATCLNTFANTDEGDKKHKSKFSSAPIELKEVTVVSSSVKRINKSAFNAVGVDTKSLQNTTLNLSDALRQVPGIKLRETGGVGSDMQLMLDGFSGKHIKVFIDGVPQEGIGQSFGLNNIPVTYADHIEVYRGVVPVEFGTDAIGGVINVVTKKNARSWHLGDLSRRREGYYRQPRHDHG